jgi:Endoribonuclease L-PSP
MGNPELILDVSKLILDDFLSGSHDLRDFAVRASFPDELHGVYATTTQHQLRQTMRNLLDNLEEANMNFDQVVATNVYLDDLSDLKIFDEVYGQYLGPVLPARTTQQISPTGAQSGQRGPLPWLGAGVIGSRAK